MVININSYGNYNSGKITNLTLDTLDYDDLVDFEQAAHELLSSKHIDNDELMFEIIDNGTGFNKLCEELFEYQGLKKYEQQNVDLLLELYPHDVKYVMQKYDDISVFESWDDLIEQTFINAHNIPKHVEYYLDYDKIKQDLGFDGWFETSSGKVINAN